MNHFFKYIIQQIDQDEDNIFEIINVNNFDHSVSTTAIIISIIIS